MTKKHQKFIFEYGAFKKSIFALSCGFGGERISRHNQLRDALFDTAVAAGLGPVKEGRFLLLAKTEGPLMSCFPTGMGGKMLLLT